MIFRVVALSVMCAISTLAMEISVGDPFPELRGEYLNGKDAVMPGDANGKVALLLLGFTYKSRFPVEAWTKRFREEFEKNSHVTFYEIPMIGGMARLGKWFIDSGMRRGTPKADQGNVITVYGGTDAWKQRLGVKNDEWAYLVLLDSSGKIAWRYSGPFDDAKYPELAEQVKRLVGP